jgi:hypothetical protein
MFPGISEVPFSQRIQNHLIDWSVVASKCNQMVPNCLGMEERFGQRDQSLEVPSTKMAIKSHYDPLINIENI